VARMMRVMRGAASGVVLAFRRASAVKGSLCLRALFLFQRGVDCGVGADFVVGAVSPALHREIFGIDLRHAALSHHDFAKDVAVHRHGGAEQLVLTLIGGRGRRQQLHREGYERNLLLQLAEGRFIHANAA